MTKANAYINHSFSLLVTFETLATYLFGPKVRSTTLALERGILSYFNLELPLPN